jgi:hypothetical protein
MAEELKKSNIVYYSRNGIPTIDENLYADITVCSSFIESSDSVKRKIKDTNLERYGAENAIHSAVIKEKTKQSNLQRYGVEFACQNEEIKEKVRATNLERYGVENVFMDKPRIKNAVRMKYGVDYATQSQDIKDKTANTIIKKYGSIENFHRVVKEKTLKTQIQKYGGWFFGSPIGRMTEKNLIDIYGYTEEEYKELLIRKSKTNGNQISKVSQECFKRIMCGVGIDGDDVLSGDTELRIVTSSNKIYKYDFAYKNKIIEFNGDYWHANPSKYSEHTLIRCGKTPHTARYVWDRDRAKIEAARIHGYTVYIIWEEEYLKYP